MEGKRIYSTAFLGSRSPGYKTKEPRFYRCSVCGCVDVRFRPLGNEQQEEKSLLTCCNQPMELLLPKETDIPDNEHKMDFSIFGGFDHNTIRIEIDEGHHPMDTEHCIEWIYLHTFQGGQMKYLSKKKESATMFSMANEDAFVFCGRDVCKYCKYQCKRGHIAYAYCSRHGLFGLKI